MAAIVRAQETFGSIEQGKVSRGHGNQKVLIQGNASLSFMGHKFKSFSQGKLCFRGELLASQSLNFLSVVGALSFLVVHIQENLWLGGRVCVWGGLDCLHQRKAHYPGGPPISLLEDHTFPMSP